MAPRRGAGGEESGWPEEGPFIVSMLSAPGPAYRRVRAGADGVTGRGSYSRTMAKPHHSSGRERPPPRPFEPGVTARGVVCARLAEEVGRYPDLGLWPLDDAGLDAREAALAHALYDACVRRWITLEHLLGACLDRSPGTLEPAVRAALLCGAAQLLLLDRVPDHAAVHESVEWVKRNVRVGAGGLVNAVLRKLTRLRGGRAVGPDGSGEPSHSSSWDGARDSIPLSDGRVLRFTEAVLPEEPVERLAAAGGVPLWLSRRWTAAFGADEAARLVLHTLSHAPVILNTESADPANPLPESLRPHDGPGHHVFEGSHAELVALLESRGDVWVQDPAAAAAVRSVRGLRPRVIVDACAGLGTKTRQLAAVFPEAQIVATDTDVEHVKALAQAFYDHGRIRALPQPLVQARFRGKADLVLLDVPCSNTGVLARRVEARHRADAAHLARLVALQARIIDECVPLLADGGTILYSTCSLEAEENERQAAAAAERHGIRVERGALRLPRGGPGRPAREHGDGSFKCTLYSNC